MIIIYTDGSCNNNGPNKGTGGWGAILRHLDLEKRICGYASGTTSNRMELTAPLMALSTLKRHDLQIELFSDSQYLIKGITEWSTKWVRNGWRNTNGDEVTNKDLWVKLLKWDTRLKIRWKWIKGHSGHKYQEIAHHLADDGRTQLIKL